MRFFVRNIHFYAKKYAKMYKYTQKCEKYLYFMQN